MNSTFEYDVVLSFAGENRAYVDKVAAALQLQEIKVFYDEFEKVKLWGKDLIEHLDQIYRIKGRFCVMFISQYYAVKAWPTQERRSAQARAFHSSQEYILPARFDKTEIPGVLPTVGYIDLNDYTPEKFAELVVAKIRGDLVAKKVPTISHHTVRLEFLFSPSPSLNATLSEIEDAALQSMLQIVTSDYGRKISFPYSLRGGFFEKTNDRILYQIDHQTGFTNFKIQDNLALNRNGSLESIQNYRWEQDKDTLFDLEKAVRHSIYLFNFVCRWLSGLSSLLNHQWDATTVTLIATMPKDTILFDNNGFVETEMEVARFNGPDEMARGSVVLSKNMCQSSADLTKQMGRLLNFVLNNFEYSAFGKKKFTKITDDVIGRANQLLMAKVNP
jgi:hypothetical protein